MDIKARIPGTIISVNVAEGDTVKARSIVCVMEAMKMEQPVACPADGTVKAVHVAAGDKVKAGTVLVTLE